jgi:hypothetical protein
MRRGIVGLVVWGFVVTVAAEPKWEEVLGPSQGKIPVSRAALVEGVKVVTFQKATAETRVTWEGIWGRRWWSRRRRGGRCL